MVELPSIQTIISILQKHRKGKNLEFAKCLHAHICNNGLEAHTIVGNFMVPMLVECGSMHDARHVFNRLVHRNEHSWTSFLIGYIECGQSKYAINLYQQMQEEGIHPSKYTLKALLRACMMLKDVGRGRQAHFEITKWGFEEDIIVGNALVSMYAKSGLLTEAQLAFEKLSARTLVSWNILIAGHAEHGASEEVLKLIELMQVEGICPNAVTFCSGLKTCSSLVDIEKGREMHSEVVRKGFELDPFVSSVLVEMYAKCGSLSEAREVFNKVPFRDVVLWTVLIAGYAESGPAQEAVECFKQMQLEGITPDPVTYVSVLKACASMGTIHQGQDVHAEIKQQGFDKELFVGNALIDMYAKCNSILEAKRVFDMMQVRDVVSWNALIAGYAEHGPGEEALKCLKEMQSQSISPSTATYLPVLKACGRIRDANKGREIHMEISEKGFENNLFVASTLVDMYAKCGALLEAHRVFNMLQFRDVVAWNALIAGYVEHGPGQEALKFFEQMQLEGVIPTTVTFVSGLKSCSSIGAIYKGREIHTAIRQMGFEGDLVVGNALIDMYAKFGSLLEARIVFEELSVRDVVSWSTMIKGYGINHEANMALQFFQDMQEQGMMPNSVTFTCVLTACSHASLIFKGQKYFNAMMEDHGILPTVDHYTCMVDLLARSGQLTEAEKLLEIMPCSPTAGAWTSLLSACKTYGEVEGGLRCFQELVQMDPTCTASYILMANVYASAGRSDLSCQIEEMRKNVGAKKKRASALIEINKNVHEFVLGDKESEEISAMLEFMGSYMNGNGHVPKLDQVMRFASDEEKETALCEHAEKLAVAFGLLNTPRGQTLRVTKNMRMCNNCHNTNSLTSKIERREIIIRDGYSIHHFKDGRCSCWDVL